MTTPTHYGQYGLDERRICFRLPDGSWKVVRELDAEQAVRVRNACQKLPMSAGYLLRLLDPGQQTPGDPAEDWAWGMVEETER